MPITKDDLQNITSAEMSLVKDQLGLKTQTEVDKAYGKGKQAGIDESKDKLASYDEEKKELETLRAEKEKTEATKEIEKKMTELKLDLTPEDKEKFLNAVDGDIDKVESLAGLITGSTPNNAEPNIHTPGGGTNTPVDNPSAKNDKGNYEDPVMNAMDKKF